MKCISAAQAADSLAVGRVRRVGPFSQAAKASVAGTQTFGALLEVRRALPSKVIAVAEKTGHPWTSRSTDGVHLLMSGVGHRFWNHSAPGRR